jgi:hypothetical protein
MVLGMALSGAAGDGPCAGSIGCRACAFRNTREPNRTGWEALDG